MSKKFHFLIIALLVGVTVYTIYDHVEGQATERERAQQQASTDDLAIAVSNKVGQRAPHIELIDLAGNKVQLSDYRGQKVLVNFWATWCPSCQEEMPDMQRFYEDYSDDVTILGVNLTMAERSIKDVGNFVQEMGVTFPIILDTDREAINAYRVVVYPTTFAIDEDGIIKEVIFGALDYEKMQQALDVM